MHAYLRSIGFTEASRSEHEVELLMDDVFRNYQLREAVKDESGQKAFVELTKTYGPDIGIKLCGEMDVHGFHRQYYIPFLKGSGITTEEEISVDRRVRGDSYVGVCEDGRVGISLIFYVQNPAEYQRKNVLNILNGTKMSMTLSGLALNGMILLPMKSNESQRKEQSSYFSRRNALVAAAKNGNPEAMESLTIDDMDLYTMLSRRVEKEDIFSIVDTFFMPYGMECDQYYIMGTIRFYTRVYNSHTKEPLYQMNLECNGLNFDICIHCRDLLGDPEVGRRFKGTIWLQGKINFPN